MEKEKFRVISTKVSRAVKERIGKICRKFKIKEYELLQMMCDCIVRYMDDRHNLTPEMERVMSIFEHLEGWKNAFNLADPTAESDICEAFYVMSAKGKKGFRVIHLQRPWWDGVKDWNQSENIQQMMEWFFEVMMPERYKKLRQLAVEKGMESQLDLLDYLIDSHMDDEMNGQYRQEFEDAARAENGKPLAYGERTKRVKHQSVDMYEQISFDFDDRTVMDAEHDEEERLERERNSEEARQWLEENSNGERPYGMEW
jgi:hypothetical protein